MGKQERRAYLEAIRTRYRRADKAGKTAILDEFCAVREYHRKYALRLLGRKHRQRKNLKRKPGPALRYMPLNKAPLTLSNLQVATDRRGS